MARPQLIIWMQAQHWQLILLSPHGCQCWPIAIEQTDWRTQLLQHCQRWPTANLTLVSDLAEERYEVQTMPAVARRLRAALLARKLAAWPWAQGPHTAVALASLPTSMTSTAYLFTAIDAPQVSEALASLAGAGYQVHGLYPACLSLPCWLPMLLPLATQCVCIRTAGPMIRLSFLRQQQLLASETVATKEMARAASDSDAPMEDNPQPSASAPPSRRLSTALCRRIAQQLQHLQHSWQQQQWLSASAPLQVVWLGPLPADQTLLQACLPAHATWHWRETAAWPAKLQVPAAASALTPWQWANLYPQLQGWSLPNLTPLAMRAPSRHAAYRKQAWLLSCMTCVLLSLTALHMWYDCEALAQAQLSVPPARLPVTEAPATLALWRSHHQASEVLAAHLQLPTAALAALHQVVADQQHWRLTALAWQRDSAGGESVSMTWQTAALSAAAAEDWQQMMARVQCLPRLDQLEKLPAQSAMVNKDLQGDTGWGAAIQREQRVRVHFAGISTGTSSGKWGPSP